MPTKLISRLSYCLLFATLVGISSCAFSPRILKFRKNKSSQSVLPTSLFAENGTSAVYNTKVDFYNFHFSGLIAIKRNAANDYNVALVSEMGMTLLKMHYVNGRYEDVDVLEELNRPFVIKLIQEDLAMLMIDGDNYKRKWLSQRGNNADVLELKKKGATPFFLYYADSHVTRIDKADAAGKKVEVRVLSYENDVPGEISLKHFGFKNASLNFKKLNQNQTSPSDKKDEYDVEE